MPAIILGELRYGFQGAAMAAGNQAQTRLFSAASGRECRQRGWECWQAQSMPDELLEHLEFQSAPSGAEVPLPEGSTVAAACLGIVFRLLAGAVLTFLEFLLLAGLLALCLLDVLLAGLFALALGGLLLLAGLFALGLLDLLLAGLFALALGGLRVARFCMGFLFAVFLEGGRKGSGWSIGFFRAGAAAFAAWLRRLGRLGFVGLLRLVFIFGREGFGRRTDLWMVRAGAGSFAAWLRGFCGWSLLDLSRPGFVFGRKGFGRGTDFGLVRAGAAAFTAWLCRFGERGFPGLLRPGFVSGREGLGRGIDFGMVLAWAAAFAVWFHGFFRACRLVCIGRVFDGRRAVRRMSVGLRAILLGAVV